MDACFSGASRASSTKEMANIAGSKGEIFIETDDNKAWKNQGNFDVFTSSAPNQPSFSYDQSQSGLFTNYLCLGLSGKADKNNDLKITAGELIDFIKENVESKSVLIGSKQVPALSGSRNDIIVVFPDPKQ